MDFAALAKRLPITQLFAMHSGTSPRNGSSHVSLSRLSRRRALHLTGGAALAGAFGNVWLRGAEPDSNAVPRGAIAGEPTAEKVGRAMLASGGNAIDAAVAAAFAASVASPHNCGPGGYGGHMVVALKSGKVTCIDFNSAAPSAMRADTFKPDSEGKVPGRVNEYGWLSAGVPGTLAGLDMALKRFGTRGLAEVMAPAIKLAREGYSAGAGVVAGSRAALNELRKDAGSTRLLLRDGQPLKADQIYRNPELAEMLDSLAKRGSVDSFYRGDIALRIAEAFQKNGGLVTAADMAAYQAREARPFSLEWNGFTMHTAPLTAGGLTVLQWIACLKQLDWTKLPDEQARIHAYVEALRVAWHDRLTLLGDPMHAKVPVERLLSDTHAKESAGKVREALQTRKAIKLAAFPREQGGTVNLSVADREGNLVAVTLTHGQAFGARVTVDGLGLILGHGMSRFEVQPEHPNAPGPGKRPFNNMCPTIVTRRGKGVFALGGAGGRKIPNSLGEVLVQLVGLGSGFEAALQAPRLHTEGDMNLRVDKSWPQQTFLKQLGYKLTVGAGAKISVAMRDSASGNCRAMAR